MSDVAAPPAFQSLAEIRTPRKRVYKYTPPEQRFWKYVSPEPNSGCWLWSGAAASLGYGQLRVKSAEGANYVVLATHVSLSIHGRPLPKGMFACHTCDNPYCVNPDHLFAGTQSDNMQDCKRKGRASKPPPSVPGRQPLKTECCRGHPLSGDNLYVASPGVRQCRTCKKENKRARRQRYAAMGLTSRGSIRIEAAES